MTSYQYPSLTKKIIVTVISDLVTDHRVHRICQTLKENGFDVTLVGRRNKYTYGIKTRDYHVHRFHMWFRSSFFFYLEFNLRLFFWLLFKKYDIYLGNDLDVMPATALSAWIKQKPLVYDSHEYFLGMAGMDQKPFRRNIWRTVERFIFPRVKYIYTVSESVRNLYRRDYDKRLLVVRNLPLRENHTELLTPEEKTWIAGIDAKIPRGKKILLLQGAGLNAQRGAEELVYAMLFLDASQFHLLIIGDGEVFPTLEKMIKQNDLENKITLIPKVPFAVLDHFTRQADLGFSIDKPMIVNHRFSLPNKLFEYLHAGVPVLASRLVEQEKIINHYKVGTFIEEHHPEHIAKKITEVFADEQRWLEWKRNTFQVRDELNWENERQIIVDIFKQVEKDSVNY